MRQKLQQELDAHKELLSNYETSLRNKESITSNLSDGIKKQRDKYELLRSFSDWKQQTSDSKREVRKNITYTLYFLASFTSFWIACFSKAFTMNLARQHHSYRLMRGAFNTWHGLIENKWRERVEKACKAKAQEVCLGLTDKYEAELAQVRKYSFEIFIWVFFTENVFL